MKILIFAFLSCIMLTACHVRHYGGKQMQVRVAGAPKDTDSLHTVYEDDEPLFSLPGELVEDPDSADESITDDMSDEFDEDIDMVDEDAMKELDRLMRGQPE